MKEHKVLLKKRPGKLLIEYIGSKDYDESDKTIFNILKFNPDEWNVADLIEAHFMDNKELERYLIKNKMFDYEYIDNL